MSSARLLVLVSMTCFLAGCRNPGSGESVKFQLYYAQGENIYLAQCSNCHQRSGQGLGLVYPPLNKSDFMEKNFNPVICLIRNGKKGEITVNGDRFNQPMHGVPALTELEIAELLTYIYNTWDHSRGIVEVKDVQTALKECL